MAGMDGTRRWRDWLMLALAIWLFVSPWLLGFTGAPPADGVAAANAGFTAAAWNAWVVGVVVAALAIWAVAMFAEWQAWLSGILGVWLVVAPWALGFGAMATAMWDHVIVGGLIVVLAAWELWAVRHEGSRATA